VNKGSRDDDSRAKLLQDNEHQVELSGHHLVQQDRTKDTNGARGKDDKEQTNTQANVVVSLARLA
jgi:hypothetical protein